MPWSMLSVNIIARDFTILFNKEPKFLEIELKNTCSFSLITIPEIVQCDFQNFYLISYLGTDMPTIGLLG